MLNPKKAAGDGAGMSRSPLLSRATGVQRTTSAMLSAPHVQCDTYMFHSTTTTDDE